MQLPQRTLRSLSDVFPRRRDCDDGRAVDGGGFLLLAFEGVFQRHALGLGASDERAAHHLTPGEASTIVSVLFDSRSFERYGPAALTNDAFQFPASMLKGRHQFARAALTRWTGKGKSTRARCLIHVYPLRPSMTRFESIHSRRE